MKSDQEPFVLDVKLPAGPRQALFVEHFRALLRELFASHTGQGTTNPTSGVRRREFSGEVGLPNDLKQPTRIIFEFMSDGSLPSIVALRDPPLMDAQAWRDAISGFFSRVLMYAFADRKSHFVQRALLHYVGPALDGEYWLGGVRVAPADPNDLDPTVRNFERAMSIDMEVDAVDVHAALAISRFRAGELGTTLSFLTDVAFYRAKAEAHWVTIFDGGTTRTVRGHLGLRCGPQTISDMPKKGELCRLGSFGCRIGEFPIVDHRMTFPRETRSILRAVTVDTRDPSLRNGFNAAARLTRVALELMQVAPSASLAYRVAAVEALAHHLKPSLTFSEFMRKWLYNVGAVDPELEFLYGPVRSGHLHAGTFIAKEFDEPATADGFLDPESSSTHGVMARVRHLTRQAIANWMKAVLLDQSRN